MYISTTDIDASSDCVRAVQRVRKKKPDSIQERALVTSVPLKLEILDPLWVGPFEIVTKAISWASSKNQIRTLNLRKNGTHKKQTRSKHPTSRPLSDERQMKDIVNFHVKSRVYKASFSCK